MRENYYISAQFLTKKKLLDENCSNEDSSTFAAC